MSLFSRERRETHSRCRGESVSLPYREEANSFSLQKRECLSPLDVEEGGSSLYNIESVSPFDDSFLHKRNSVSLLYIDDAGFFSIQKRERISLLYVEEVASSPYNIESACSSICRGG